MPSFIKPPAMGHVSDVGTWFLAQCIVVLIRYIFRPTPEVPTEFIMKSETAITRVGVEMDTLAPHAPQECSSLCHNRSRPLAGFIVTPLKTYTA